MQVHRVVAEHARILEDHRPDRRLAAPVGQLLVAPARRTERVQRRRPARIGPPRAGREPGRSRSPSGHSRRRRRFAPAAPHRAAPGRRTTYRGTIPPRIRPTAGTARADRGTVPPAPRGRPAGRAPPRALLRCSAGGPRPGPRASISRFSRSASRWRMPPRSPPFHVVVDHLRQAAQLALDGLCLADEHLQHPVLDPLRQHEVVAANLRRRLQLAVDASVALFDAAGVPRQIEVEQIGAVRLEVQSLAGRVGGQQDAERIGGRVGDETPLDLLAAGAAREPVDHRDALARAVGPLDGLLQDGAPDGASSPRGSR